LRIMLRIEEPAQFVKCVIGDLPWLKGLSAHLSGRAGDLAAGAGV